MIRYFDLNITREKAKERFHDLCHKMHPDKGGDKERFIEMKNQYDSLLKAFQTGPTFTYFAYGDLARQWEESEPFSFRHTHTERAYKSQISELTKAANFWKTEHDKIYNLAKAETIRRIETESLMQSFLQTNQELEIKAREDTKRMTFLVKKNEELEEHQLKHERTSWKAVAVGAMVGFLAGCVL